MENKHIIKQENGTLYLKLREEFSPSTMQIHCTMASIHKNGVTVVKANSKGEVSSTHMTLNNEEMAILVEGFQMVRVYWDERPLPERHVLLECGCIVDWNGQHRDLPFHGEWAWCEDHEEVRVYRFNVDDFTHIEEE